MFSTSGFRRAANLENDQFSLKVSSLNQTFLLRIILPAGESQKDPIPMMLHSYVVLCFRRIINESGSQLRTDLMGS